MENRARKFIDAVQNSLIGVLIIRFAWLLIIMIPTTAGSLVFGQPLPEVFVAVALLTGPAVLFGAWIIGHLANRRLRPSSALQRLQQPVANGFDAWRQLPASGLKPTPVMSAIVMTLGQPLPIAPVIRTLTKCVLMLVVISTYLAICFFDGWITSRFPGLGTSHYRLVASWGIVATIILISVRQWAVELRARLVDPDDTSLLSD